VIVVKIAYSYTTPVIKVTYDVTEVNVSGGDPSPIYVNLDYNASGAATLLTSVGLSMPTGFSVANSPLTQSGTLAVSFAAGYSLPTDAEQAEWDTAYDRSLTAASVSGTTTKTLTLTKQDGSTLQAQWNDYDTAPVTSVFGRTGDVVATEGDYNLGQLGDVTITSPSNNQVLKYNGTEWVNGTDTDTGLTSVGLSVPTGLQVSNSPLTSNGTIAISYESGYSIPTDAKQTEWDAAYNDKINSAAVTGTSTKTLTLTQQDGGTITASWSDIDTGLTSVGLTMPAAFSVANSPLTSNGTIAVTAAGTGQQYIKGDGTLATFPTTINQALRIITEVYNKTGSTITKGTVVYIDGAHGNLPTITKALATSDATSAQTLGLVQTDITNNNNGYVVLMGKIGDLDTQAFANGTQLYLSPTTAGAYTSTKQYAPNHLVYVGVVNRSHPTQGEIEVKIQNGYELDELHDVSAQNPSNNDGIFYNTSTSLWEKKSIATVLGFTPVTNARTLTINDVAYDLSADRSWSIGDYGTW